MTGKRIVALLAALIVIFPGIAHAQFGAFGLSGLSDMMDALSDALSNLDDEDWYQVYCVGGDAAACLLLCTTYGHTEYCPTPSDTPDTAGEWIEFSPSPGISCRAVQAGQTDEEWPSVGGTDNGYSGSRDSPVEMQIYTIALDPEHYSEDRDVIDSMVPGTSALSGSGSDVSALLYSDDVEKACRPGIEGDYYIRMITSNVPYADEHSNPTDAVCYTYSHHVKYDNSGAGANHCTDFCTGKDIDYTSGMSCCGDDTGDCLLSENGKLCMELQSGTQNRWRWVNPADYPGSIFKTACSYDAILSTGSGFAACTGGGFEMRPPPDTTSKLVATTYTYMANAYDAENSFVAESGSTYKDGDGVNFGDVYAISTEPVHFSAGDKMLISTVPYMTGTDVEPDEYQNYLFKGLYNCLPSKYSSAAISGLASNTGVSLLRVFKNCSGGINTQAKYDEHIGNTVYSHNTYSTSPGVAYHEVEIIEEGDYCAAWLTVIPLAVLRTKTCAAECPAGDADCTMPNAKFTSVTGKMFRITIEAVGINVEEFTLPYTTEGGVLQTIAGTDMDAGDAAPATMNKGVVLLVEPARDNIELYFEGTHSNALGGYTDNSDFPSGKLIYGRMKDTFSPSMQTFDQTIPVRADAGGTQRDHGYMCVPEFEDTGEPAIFECAGGDTMFHSDFINEEGGSWARDLGYAPSVSEGDSVVKDDEEWFCIDNEAGGFTFFSRTIEDASACDAAFSPPKGWTGSTCCGEDIEAPEFYNDPGIVGGCWNSNIVPNGGTISAEDDRVLAAQGKFMGCALGEPSMSRNDLLSVQDTKFGGDIIEQDYYFCDVVRDVMGDGSGYNMQCTIGGIWQQQNQRPDRNQYKDITWLKEMGAEWDFDEFGCCNSTECWNGSGCSPDQTGKDVYDAMEGYVCLKGQWTEMPYFYTPYGERGYCGAMSECLYNPAQGAGVNCIDDGDYQMEFLCDSQEWTTRTRQLAAYLLHFANLYHKNNFTLFCDDYENILNYYPYTFEGVSVSEYVGRHCTVEGESGLQPCVNSFCILKYPQGIAFGTSMNTEVDDASRSFLRALNYDKDVCDSVRSGFGKCGATKAFFDRGMNLIFYMPSGTLSQPTEETFGLFFDTPIADIIDLASTRSDEARYTLFNETSMLKRLFVDVKGGRKITAFLEESRPFFDENMERAFSADYMGVDMSGHTVDACSFMSGYSGDYTCDLNNIVFSTVRNSAPSAESALASPWLDLTSKLRAR